MGDSDTFVLQRCPISAPGALAFPQLLADALDQSKLALPNDVNVLDGLSLFEE